jgi:ABC-type branched-subunit amino acid transport system ATPase component
MQVVFSIAQKIMVMYQGRTLIQGKPDEVRSIMGLTLPRQASNKC